MFNEVNEIFEACRTTAQRMHRNGMSMFDILEVLCDIVESYDIPDGTKAFNAILDQVEDELGAWITEADEQDAQEYAEVEEEWLSYYNDTRF